MRFSLIHNIAHGYPSKVGLGQISNRSNQRRIVAINVSLSRALFSIGSSQGRMPESTTLDGPIQPVQSLVFGRRIVSLPGSTLHAGELNDAEGPKESRICNTVQVPRYLTEKLKNPTFREQSKPLRVILTIEALTKKKTELIDA